MRKTWLIFVAALFITACSTEQPVDTEKDPLPTATQTPTPLPSLTPSPELTPTPEPIPRIVLSASDESVCWDIYVMEPDGSNVVQLTRDAGKNTEPDWSPDGTRIAFVSDRQGGKGIYVMDADGSNVVNLIQSDSPAGADSPDWSPDGSRIVYTDGFDIFVMNDDGSGVVQLTDSEAMDTEPSWSPDGSYIAFASVEGGQSDIYIIKPDGSGLVTPGDAASQEMVFGTDAAERVNDPLWSPDGTRIAFWGDGNIYVMAADDAATAQIVGRGFPYAWSLDGDQIIYTQRVETPGVYGVDVNDSTETLLAQTDQFAFIWSLDWMVLAESPTIQVPTIPTADAALAQLAADLVSVCEGGQVPEAPAYNGDDNPHPMVVFVRGWFYLEDEPSDYKPLGDTDHPELPFPTPDIHDVQLVACLTAKNALIQVCTYESTIGTDQQLVKRTQDQFTVEVYAAQTGELVDRYQVYGSTPEQCPLYLEEVSYHGGVDYDEVYSRLNQLYDGG